MKLKLCPGFTSAFVQKVKKEVLGFENVHIILDCYIEKSLKSGNRTGGETVCCKILDDTVVEHPLINFCQI